MSAQPPPPPPPQYQQAQYQQAPTLAAPSSGPGRKWYVVALLVLVLIGGPGLYALIEGVDGITNGLTRVAVPGQADVQLDEGTWTVFYEYSGEHDGVAYNTSRTAPPMLITVTGSGGNVPVEGSTGSFNYNIGGHAGFSIGEFAIDEAGPYTVEATVSDSTDSGHYLLALGKDLGRSTVMLVLGIFVTIGAAAIALLIFLVVIIMRGRAKRRMQAAGYSV